MTSMMDEPEAITWEFDGLIYHCSRIQECNTTDNMAVGRVIDAETNRMTGNAFMLIERDGVVIHIWQAHIEVWERLQSMIDVMLTEFVERMP